MPYDDYDGYENYDDDYGNGWVEDYVSRGKTKRNVSIKHYMFVATGGKVLKATVESGGSLRIESGGTATNVTIRKGAVAFVEQGGVMSKVSWTPCVGCVDMESGAKVTFTSKYSGVYFGSNGTLLSSAKVMDGKKVHGDSFEYGYYYYGGYDDEGSVEDYAEMYVMSGGTATETSVDNARITIWNGGIANNTSITSGVIKVYSGGKANNTVVNGGRIDINKGGSVDGLELRNAMFTVESGTRVNNVSVLSGASLCLDERASVTNIEWTPGVGNIFLDDGAKVTFTSTHSGVYYASNHRLESHAQTMTGKYVKGTDDFSGNDLGGAMYVMSAGTATDTKVNGGLLQVWNGGTASSTIINGGYLYLTSGGKVCDTKLIGDDWAMFFAMGGTASNTTIGQGCMYVQSGAIAKGIVINDDGYGGRMNSYNLVVQSGGIATDITVSSNHDDYDEDWKHHVASVKASDYDDYDFHDIGYDIPCQIFVASGGIATNIHLGSNCILAVESGGKVGNITKEAGARVIARKGAILNCKYTLVEKSPDADDGWNDWVYKSKSKKINDLVVNSEAEMIDSDTESIRLDTNDITEGESYLNYIGYGDTVDYGKIHLDHAAKLSLSVTAAGASKITIWKLNETEKKGTVSYSLKSLQSTKLTLNKLTGIYSADTKPLLIEAGDYYLSVESTSTKKQIGDIYYDVKLNQAESKFFTKGDNSDDWTDMKTAGDASDTLVDFGVLSDATTTVLENEWVGFGDAVDYRKFTLSGSAKLSFTVKTTDTVNVAIYQLVEKTKGNSLKKVQETTFKSGEADTKSLLLGSGKYYLMVQSANAKKGGNGADYSVEINRKVNGKDGSKYTEFFPETLVDDNWTDLKTLGAAGNVGTFGSLSVNSTDTLSDWVGYGDAIDYRGFTVDAGTQLAFEVEATGASKFTVYELVPKTKSGKTTYSLKTLQSLTLVEKDGFFQCATDPITFGKAGTYYFSMESTNAKKGGSVYYTVAVDVEGGSGLPADTVAPTVTNVRADITTPTNRNVTVTASFDDNVGVVSELYRIGENGAWKSYEDGVTVSENTTVYFKAVDAAGNESEVARYNVTNIQTPPDNVVSGTVVPALNSAFVSANSVYEDTRVSGGRLYIMSGGTAIHTIVDYGTVTGEDFDQDFEGQVFVRAGGSVDNTVISGGGWLRVEGGGTADNTVISGGLLQVESGGTATNINWTPCEGTVNISSGAVATFASQYSGVYLGSDNQLVSHADTISDKQLDATWEMYVMSGGTADRTTINGCYEDEIWYMQQEKTVMSGGKVTNTDIVSGGMLTVSRCGLADNTFVSAYGSLFISSGGTAGNTTVAQDGELTVRAGGSADNTAISGGLLRVESGGTATNINWTPCEGSVFVENGAYVTFASQISGVYFGANGQLVSHAAVMIRKELDESCEMNVMSGGTAFQTEVTSGGMTVFSGGTANSVTLYGGDTDWEGECEYVGSLYVSSGGTATNIDASAGAYVGFEVAPDTRVQGTRDGRAFEMKNGVISGYTASNGGLDVCSGGTATDIFVSGGSLVVSSGGTATDVIVVRERFHVASGGVANNVFVGVLDECDGEGEIMFDVYGTINKAVISSGGWGFACSGGVLNSVTLYDGGRIDIESGGRVNDLVFSGGYVDVEWGSVVSNLTVDFAEQEEPEPEDDDEYEYYGRARGIGLERDAKLTGRITILNGTISAYDAGAILDFDLTRTSIGATALVNDLSKIEGTLIYTLTVDGTQESGEYRLADGASAFNSAITVVNALEGEIGSLSVGQTSMLIGSIYTLKLADGSLSVIIDRVIDPEDADFGTNSTPLVDMYTINDKLASTTIGATKTAITTEIIKSEDDIVSRDFNDVTYGSFVGFGDEWDYAEVVLNCTGNITLSLEIYGTTNTTSELVLYKLAQNFDGIWEKSSVGSLSVKTDATVGVGCGSQVVKVKEASSSMVKYFVGVQVDNAMKDRGVYYNAYATLEDMPSASLSMPETDNLDAFADSSLNLTDSLSFGPYDTDALADASAASLATLDDKSGWLNIASLA